MAPLSEIKAIMITTKDGKELNLKDNDEINRYLSKRSNLDMLETRRDCIVKIVQTETFIEGTKEIYLRYFQPPALKTKTAMIVELANFIVGTKSTN